MPPSSTTPITFAAAAAGLQALARADIRDLPPSTWQYEPFRRRMCLDLGWITDWMGHRATWPWQRSEPYQRIPCPDYTGDDTTRWPI